MPYDNEYIINTIMKAKEDVMQENSTGAGYPSSDNIQWPIDCTIGPGLEGAIACESAVGYVNGSAGMLVYRGYNIFDLAAYCTYEEVAYLLLHGELPTTEQLEEFKGKLLLYSYMPSTLRRIMSFPLENMHSMAALRLAVNMLRQEFTQRDRSRGKPTLENAIGADEDSIAMETQPFGEPHAVFEFIREHGINSKDTQERTHDGSDLESCYHIISGVGTLAASIGRIKKGHLPIEPVPDLSYAGNYLYMLRGERPTPLEARILDIALILHADHGMNASTFASMVVASTLSDVYQAAGAAIAALSGPLHGGANELVVKTLRKIGSPKNVKNWLKERIANKKKIMGFGHRVYKTYDPRARILGPISKMLSKNTPKAKRLFRTATELEEQVVAQLGGKGIYPNVDFYSGLMFSALGIPSEYFTTVFAVSRTSGWTARIMEYLEQNRIFRPRAMYVGPDNRSPKPIAER